ncbi:MAG TPA: hydrogenase iron-sulfur subunit [Candidatus Altiarchaeales archaeon]|nr:hydrogenase iron-sulfur subunit [Candidatus Altiarchaeales archaeon]
MASNGSKSAGEDISIVAFLCNWCSYAGADLAGTSRRKYPENIRIIRVMCSSRVSPIMVLDAFKNGADAVLIAGCHPNDCHYSTGNFYTRRRFSIFRRLLDFLGIEKERLRIEWISASEGDKFAKIVNEMLGEVSRIGKLNFSDIYPERNY